METFREEIRPWRIGDSFDPRPPPLIIETYLDTADLTPTQALVVLDSNEKRWNVTEALENAANRAGLNAGIRRGERGPAKAQQIVLERWKIELTYEPGGVRLLGFMANDSSLCAVTHSTFLKDRSFRLFTRRASYYFEPCTRTFR